MSITVSFSRGVLSVWWLNTLLAVMFLIPKSSDAQTPQAVLSLPEIFTISRSDSGQAIPIVLDNTAVGRVRGGLQVFIAFPPQNLEILGLERTERTTQIETFEVNIPTPGDLRVVILSFAGSNPIEAGVGPVARIRMNVKDGTPRGTVLPLEIIQDGHKCHCPVR